MSFPKNNSHQKLSTIVKEGKWGTTFLPGKTKLGGLPSKAKKRERMNRFSRKKKKKEKNRNQ